MFKVHSFSVKLVNSTEERPCGVIRHCFTCTLFHSLHTMSYLCCQTFYSISVAIKGERKFTPYDEYIFFPRVEFGVQLLGLGLVWGGCVAQVRVRVCNGYVMGPLMFKTLI